MRAFGQGGRRRAVVAGGVIALVLASVAGCEDDGPTGMQPVMPEMNACLTLEDFAHTSAIARPPGRSYGAAINGDVLAAANGSDGLFLFDIFDPSMIGTGTPVAITDARAVALSETHAFVAAGAGGLVVVDAASGSVVATVPTPGFAVDVIVSSDRAYVANEVVGLVIVDVSNPALPAVLGIENTPGRYVGVAVVEPLAFVADRDNGLVIMNVSDPSSPFIVKRVAVPGVARGVAADGNLVAVAAQQAGLQLVDASAPSAAEVVGSHATYRDALAAAFSGDALFVVEGSGGIEVFDVRKPSQPVLAQRLVTTSIAWDVTANDGRAAVAEDGGGVRALTATAPIAPRLDVVMAGDIRTVAKYDDYILAIDANFGMRVFDPARGAVVGDIFIPRSPTQVSVAPPYVYVLAGTDFLRVDMSDPENPRQAGNTVLTDTFDDMAVAGEFMYLLESEGVLIERRLDSPASRNFTASNAYFTSITVVGSYVFLADRRGNVWAVSRSTMNVAAFSPVGGSAERVVYRLEDGPFGPGSVPRWHVAISGLADGRGGMETYDFGNVIFPDRIRSVPGSIPAIDVALTSTHVLTLGAAGGMEVFERAEDGSARPVGYFPQTGLRVVDAGDRFAVAGGEQGLFLIGFDGCQAAR
jgi:hypothetical protein